MVYISDIVNINMSGDEEGLPKQHKGKREKQHKENRSGKYLRRIQACVEIARRGERLKSGGNPAVG